MKRTMVGNHCFLFPDLLVDMIDSRFSGVCFFVVSLICNGNKLVKLGQYVDLTTLYKEEI